MEDLSQENERGICADENQLTQGLHICSCLPFCLGRNCQFSYKTNNDSLFLYRYLVDHLYSKPPAERQRMHWVMDEEWWLECKKIGVEPVPDLGNGSVITMLGLHRHFEVFESRSDAVTSFA